VAIVVSRLLEVLTASPADNVPAQGAASWFGEPYPNPANPRLAVPVFLPTAGEVRLTLFDLRGRQVLQWSEQVGAGPQVVAIDPSRRGVPVASGTYLLSLRHGAVSQVRRITLVQ
jgi:hypothetical protein